MLSLATGHAFELESPQSWDEKDKNWNIISCSEMHKNNSLYGCSLHRTDSQFSQAHIINEYFILAFVWKMACTATAASATLDFFWIRHNYWEEKIYIWMENQLLQLCRRALQSHKKWKKYFVIHHSSLLGSINLLPDWLDFYQVQLSLNCIILNFPLGMPP